MRPSKRLALRRLWRVSAVAVIALGVLVLVAAHVGVGSALLNDSRLTAGAIAAIVVVVLAKVVLFALGGHRLRNHRSRSETRHN